MTAIQSPSLGLIQIPTATVEIRTRAGWLPTMFLIDSGSDMTVISHELGAVIGWQSEPEDEQWFMQGVTGREPFVFRRLQLRVGRKRVQARVAWAQSNLRVNVLGRLDVFDAFDILFRQSVGRTVFRAVKS